MTGRKLYADQQNVSDPAECHFYHTMEIPGYGLVRGQWDLRNRMREYTGEVDFRGQRVLEVGTASGFVCFWMEQQGAEVVAQDLSVGQSWDVVPIASVNYQAETEKRRDAISKIHNAYWLAHKAYRSKAKAVYGTVYDIPLAIGAVDISTFCSVLLHLRDPFLALANAARLTKHTILVTDVLGMDKNAAADRAKMSLPIMQFIPNFRAGGPLDSWWFLSPQIIVAFLGILGFEDSTVSYHSQLSIEGERELFSVVAHRTVGSAPRS